MERFRFGGFEFLMNPPYQTKGGLVSSDREKSRGRGLAALLWVDESMCREIRLKCSQDVAKFKIKEFIKIVTC